MKKQLPKVKKHLKRPPDFLVIQLSMIDFISLDDFFKRKDSGEFCGTHHSTIVNDQKKLGYHEFR